MSELDALLLGIIQGLTEFLPVSSSGHLELGKAILGDTSLPSESLLFTVVVHFATALSTIVVVGVLFDEEIEALFNGNILFVGFMLIVTALLLWLADKAKDTNKNVSFPNALTIGISQAIAILPGISRSGATISTAVLLGIDKTKAARFSFLMVVPLILGKIAKDIMSGDITTTSSNNLVLIIGFTSAFVAGLVACTWMIKLVKKSKLSYFAIYCLVVGLIAIGVAYFQ